ncbi:MAG: hypothetical protein K0Q91_147 [Fibrobacteria bacterium]|jgi:hypothetical protein|nr:hypothetical protein [Fibrobacteria bacterium]
MEFKVAAGRAVRKDVVKTWIACGAVSLFLAGCLGGGTEGENASAEDMAVPGITVQVVDSTGVAFGADTVYWSYVADPLASDPPSFLPKAIHGTDTSMKAALRLNAAGTRWWITYEGLHGAVYIRALYYNRPDSANHAHCAVPSHGYLATRADTLPRVDTLVLIKRGC